MFGNITFVSELYHKQLIYDSTMCQIINALLCIGPESSKKNINDNTLEAVIKIFTKLGWVIEDRI